MISAATAQPAIRHRPLEGVLLRLARRSSDGRVQLRLAQTSPWRRLESIEELAPGLPLGYKAGEHQATHRVWAVTLTEAGEYRPLDLAK